MGQIIILSRIFIQKQFFSSSPATCLAKFRQKQIKEQQKLTKASWYRVDAVRGENADAVDDAECMRKYIKAK